MDEKEVKEATEDLARQEGRPNGPDLEKRIRDAIEEDQKNS
jgi:hypothetical protein